MLHETLQPLLAPVVLVSACGLLVMALNARMMTAKARIRQFHLERLTLHDQITRHGSSTPTQSLRYQGVAVQSDIMLLRLRMMRAALMCVVGCVGLMLGSSLLIGLHSAWGAPWLETLAVGLLVAGIGIMLIGVVIFWCELSISLREIRYEHARVMNLALPAHAASAPIAPKPD